MSLPDQVQFLDAEAEKKRIADEEKEWNKLLAAEERLVPCRLVHRHWKFEGYFGVWNANCAALRN